MKKILIVDDIPEILQLVSEIIEEESNREFKIITAGNGEVALDLISLKKPDLIITDIKMSPINGIQLLHQVKEIDSNIPVVFITGFADILEINEALELGASDLLIKPFNSDEVIEIINKYLPEEESEKSSSVNEDDFCRIDLNRFTSGKEIPCSLYIKIRANHFVKLANKGDPIPKKQLLKYKKKNLQFLHVLKDEFSEFVGFNMKVLSALEKESDVKEEKVNNFINYTNAILMENTFLNELGEDEIDEILEYSSLTFSILKKQKSLFKLLQNLAENHEPVYAHSLSTAVLSYLIAKKVGWTTEPVLFKIFLASLLHDIGKRDVSPEILNKNPAFFTVEEKEEYESHPQRGMEILNALGGLQSEVILAAYQHHENCVGKGYPLGLTKQKISPISRLISCTDIICDHLIGNKKITLKNYQQGMIEVLKFKRKSYDPLFLNALAEILEINLDEF